MPETNDQPSEPIHDEVRYEPSDVSLRGILAFGIGLVVLGIVVHVGISWLLAVFARQEKTANPPLPAVAQERPRLPGDLQRIPAPRLEESEERELRELRNEEAARLQSYGWVDRKTGTVRIPIEEAMDMLADPKTAERHGIRMRPNPPK
jgi:hypothetical protein